MQVHTYLSVMQQFYYFRIFVGLVVPPNVIMICDEFQLMANQCKVFGGNVSNDI